MLFIPAAQVRPEVFTGYVYIRFFRPNEFALSAVDGASLGKQFPSRLDNLRVSRLTEVSGSDFVVHVSSRFYDHLLLFLMLHFLFAR